jgi:CheY-like chemotaxis protein
MKILIIEDIKEDFRNLKNRISELEVIPYCKDYENDTELDRILEIYVSNKREALQEYIFKIIQDNHEDLRVIICDLRLIEENNKNYSGEDVIKWIREEIVIESYPLFTKYIPIIIYTQHTKLECTKSALNAGGSFYIQKDKNYFINNVAVSQAKIFNNLCNEFIFEKPYKISITFCGNDTRQFVKDLANLLAVEFSKHKVFFDEFHQEKITAMSAGDILEKIYTQQSEYVVVFISENYLTNHWTGKVEWKAIKESLIPKRKEAIIPVLYNDNINFDEIDLNNDIAIKVSQYPNQSLTSQAVADIIIKIVNQKK